MTTSIAKRIDHLETKLMPTLPLLFEDTPEDLERLAELKARWPKMQEPVVIHYDDTGETHDANA